MWILLFYCIYVLEMSLPTGKNKRRVYYGIVTRNTMEQHNVVLPLVNLEENRQASSSD